MFKDHPSWRRPTEFWGNGPRYRTDYFAELKIEPMHMWEQSHTTICITLLSELGIPEFHFFLPVTRDIRTIWDLKKRSTDGTDVQRAMHIFCRWPLHERCRLLTSAHFCPLCHYPHYWMSPPCLWQRVRSLILLILQHAEAQNPRIGIRNNLIS